jgi:hypothetical protein
MFRYPALLSLILSCGIQYPDLLTLILNCRLRYPALSPEILNLLSPALNLLLTGLSRHLPEISFLFPCLCLCLNYTDVIQMLIIFIN